MLILWREVLKHIWINPQKADCVCLVPLFRSISRSESSRAIFRAGMLGSFPAWKGKELKIKGLEKQRFTRSVWFESSLRRVVDVASYPATHARYFQFPLIHARLGRTSGQVLASLVKWIWSPHFPSSSYSWNEVSSNIGILRSFTFVDWKSSI